MHAQALEDHAQPCGGHHATRMADPKAGGPGKHNRKAHRWRRWTGSDKSGLERAISKNPCRFETGRWMGMMPEADVVAGRGGAMEVEDQMWSFKQKKGRKSQKQGKGRKEGEDEVHPSSL